MKIMYTLSLQRIYQEMNPINETYMCSTIIDIKNAMFLICLKHSDRCT
jgi:hypothetical protein